MLIRWTGKYDNISFRIKTPYHDRISTLFCDVVEASCFPRRYYLLFFRAVTAVFGFWPCINYKNGCGSSFFWLFIFRQTSIDNTSLERKLPSYVIE